MNSLPIDDTSMTESTATLRPPSATLVLAVLAVFVLLAWLGMQTADIAPRPSPAAIGGFSAENVMATTRRIAREPHPMGSAANADVRAYLVAQLQALGLEPRVQRGFGVFTTPNGSAAGVPHNIVARLPGSGGGSGKALMLSAHYDSVVNGFGAADDGASVASILETLRVLKAGASLRNDVIVLFTDGEEAGLLGADAFVNAHPWAKEVGLVLNFEFRGNEGPMFMFETSAGNGQLISGFATSPRPIGSSLMYEIYRAMPNSTDMSVFKNAGLPGMNFAAIGGMSSYHTWQDRPERISPTTLQHQGETMLALARHFGNADLAAIKSADVAYFNLPGVGLVTYSSHWILPLSIGVALLFGFAFHRGVKSGALRVGRTLLALPVFLLLAILLAIGAFLLWLGVCTIHPEYGALPEAYNAGWYWLGIVALSIGGFAFLAARLRRRIAPLELAMGTMLGWLLALFASVLWAPGFNFLLVFSMAPVLAVLALLLAQPSPQVERDRSLLLLALAAVPGIVLFAPLLLGLFHAVTTHFAAIVVVVLALLLGILAPLFVGLARSRLMPSLPLVAGLACVATGLLTARFDQQHPVPNSLIYVQNDGVGKALWLSPDADLDAWTESVFGPTPVRRNVTEAYGPQGREYWVAPAPALGIPAPVVEVLRDRVHHGSRVVDVRVRSVRNAPETRLFLEGAELHGATVQGREVGTRTSGRWGLILYAIPERGLDVSLRVKPGQAFQLRAIDRSYGLPATGLPARQPGMMVNADSAGDTVQAVRLVSFQ